MFYMENMPASSFRLLNFGGIDAMNVGPCAVPCCFQSGDRYNYRLPEWGEGQAIFKLRADGAELHYKLIVANIEDVFMAHIHLGAADESCHVDETPEIRLLLVEGDLVTTKRGQARAARRLRCRA